MLTENFYNGYDLINVLFYNNFLETFTRFITPHLIHHTLVSSLQLSLSLVLVAWVVFVSADRRPTFGYRGDSDEVSIE